MTERPDIGALLAAITPLMAGPPQTNEGVGQAFCGAMRALARFDHVVVFAYRGQATPVDLFSTFDPSGYQTFVALYQAGPYLLDPFFHAALAGRTGLWRMRDLAPDRFFPATISAAIIRRPSLPKRSVSSCRWQRMSRLSCR